MFSNPESSQSKVDYKFIVVYDDFSKQVANSVKNRARENGISSTSWSKKQYLDQEARLNNDNHILFLSKDLIMENLSNPSLKAHPVCAGVDYKIQGNVLGIIAKNLDFVEMAKQLGQSLKEDWLQEVGILIAGGLIGGTIFGTARFISKTKKARLYLLYKATDIFANDLLLKFVGNKLN